MWKQSSTTRKPWGGGTQGQPSQREGHVEVCWQWGRHKRASSSHWDWWRLTWQQFSVRSRPRADTGSPLHRHRSHVVFELQRHQEETHVWAEPLILDQAEAQAFKQIRLKFRRTWKFTFVSGSTKTPEWNSPIHSSFFCGQQSFMSSLSSWTADS